MLHYKKEVTTRLVELNWDQECHADLITGNGFEITESAYDKKTKKKNENGILSPKFATEWSDDHAFADRYSCECKELKGKRFEGELCPNCNTTVIYKDVDYRVTGWIKLNNYPIIQPSFYILLSSLIGEDTLKDIVTYEKQFDINGLIIRTEDPEMANNPYFGIGISEFRNKFEEVCRYFYNKKKTKKPELLDFLLESRESVFASCVPVFSSVLRPESIKYETFYFNTENRTYGNIFKLSRELYNFDDRKAYTHEMIKVENILSQIQEKVMILYNSVFSVIIKKEGFIKQNNLGGRLSYTSRCVIVPSSELDCDEIELPYLSFLELYKFEIIGYLVNINDISEAQAFEIWNMAAVDFDERIYEIMEFIVKKDNPMVLINRNPTINYGSILCVRVKRVKRSYKDQTMSLPITILKVFNADFDGDAMNIISLKTKKLKKKMAKYFDPKTNFYISRLDGLFNPDFDLLKDQQVGFYDFNNI